MKTIKAIKVDKQLRHVQEEERIRTILRTCASFPITEDITTRVASTIPIHYRLIARLLPYNSLNQIKQRTQSPRKITTLETENKICLKIKTVAVSLLGVEGILFSTDSM